MSVTSVCLLIDDKVTLTHSKFPCGSSHHACESTTLVDILILSSNKIFQKNNFCLSCLLPVSRMRKLMLNNGGKQGRKEGRSNLPVHFKLPISLFADRNVAKASSVVLWITATKDQLTSWCSRGVPRMA